MTKKGFVLAETLVVVIFVMIIFTLMYNSAVPLLGRYDEISLYDDLDTTYDVYQFKRLIEASDSALNVVNAHYKKIDCSNFSSETNRCNSIKEYLNMTSLDTILYINTKYLNEVTNDTNIREEIRDYLNYVKIDPDKCILVLDHDEHISYMDFTEYKITYNLKGGTASPPNRTKYYIGTETFTLNHPTKRGYDFTGWTGSNGNILELTVTIPQGSKGNRIYNANWKPTIYNINYNLNNGYEGSWCQNEGEGSCSFTGKKRIYYGTKHLYNYKDATNSIVCSNDVFGDPLVGYAKECYQGTNPLTYTIETPTFTLNNPARTGFTFTGWSGTDLTGSNNKNVKIYIDSIGNRNYTANWKANELIFSGTTIYRTYGDPTSSVSFTGASNGTGFYTYTEKSEKNSSGTNTNYISVSGTSITIQNTIPAGTYKYVVNARDDGSGSTKDAEFTINVAKAASAVYCNSATYTGGAIQSYYATSGCTVGSNGSATEAGSYTVTCNGDSNHNDSSCVFTINKAASAIYCNSAQTYTGGGIQSYYAAYGCSSVSNGVVVGAGDYWVTCNGDSNHNDSACYFTVFKAWAWMGFYHQQTKDYAQPYPYQGVLNAGNGPNQSTPNAGACASSCPTRCATNGFMHWYCNSCLNTNPNYPSCQGGGAHCWCGMG